MSSLTVELLDLWQREPWTMVEDLFQVKPFPWQVDAFCDFVANDRIAIKSGHGPGKTAWLAWLTINWLMTRHPAKVGCTAPSSAQMFDALWSELAHWHSKMPAAFRACFNWKTDRFENAEHPNVSFATARTARRENPDALAGLHSPNMLFLVDEAAGVDDAIFETAQGALSTKGSKVVLTGNPTRLEGYFYECFHRNRAYWKTRTVTSLDSPMNDPDGLLIGGIRNEWGEDSNIYRVRVLGEFPTADEDVVIPLHVVEPALSRDVEQVPSDEVWGVDVSRGESDLNALAKRRGNVMAEKIKTWRSADLMQTVGKIKMEYDSAKEKPVAIYVDSIGLGAGVADRLAEQGLPVVPINVAETLSVQPQYNRLRDELWYEARRWFYGRDVRMVDDKDLIGELCSVKMAKETSTGKLRVETKDEMKKRIRKSPDRADAFNLTFAGKQFIVRKPQKLIYPRMAYA